MQAGSLIASAGSTTQELLLARVAEFVLLVQALLQLATATTATLLVVVGLVLAPLEEPGALLDVGTMEGALAV